MLANQKVWGSIPSQGTPFLFCPTGTNLQEFYTEIPGENTS